MPRPRRNFSAGLYHLAAHGSDERQLFLSDADRTTFLHGLGLLFDRFELGLLAYTLMGNHYHLVLRTPDARVSRAMQQLHTWYSRLHNRLHKRSAHLFRAHFFARELESDADLLSTCRYLAWNPPEAGLATDPFAWRWSSAPATAGLVATSVRLEHEYLQAAFAPQAGWQDRYRAFIAS